MTHPLLTLCDHLDTLIDSDLETAMADLHAGKLDGWDDAPDDILSIWTLQDTLREQVEAMIKGNGDITGLAQTTASLWAASGALERGRTLRQ